MAHQCPTCPKTFNSKAALKSHTGTADPKLRRPHLCPKCDGPFCSQRAMEAHRNSPSHIVFSCNVCDRPPFKSKKALADHRKALNHRTSDNVAEVDRKPSVVTITDARNVCIPNPVVDQSIIQVLTLPADFFCLGWTSYICGTSFLYFRRCR